MPSFTQLASHRFLIDLPIAWVKDDIERIATVTGLNLMIWDVDGLGPARGAMIRGGKDHVFVLESLQQARIGDERAFEIRADGVDLVAEGLSSLIDEVAESLHLDRSMIVENNVEIVELAQRLTDAQRG